MDKTEPQQQPPSPGFPPKSVAAPPPAKGLQTSSLPSLNPSGVSSSISLPSQLDLDLVSLESSSSSAYTSFKDLLTSTAVNSPTAAVSSSYGREISIRNRLGKQAASAYPTSSSSSSSNSAATNFLRRLRIHVSWCNLFGACILFVNRHVIPSITRAIDRILHSIRV